MTRGVPASRGLAVLAAAAFVLHQLRWMVAPDPHAVEAGHAYLALAGPAVAAVLALACGGFALALVRARRGAIEPVARPPAFARLWPAASGALALTYLAQELLEGAIAGGHAAGLAAATAHGGWSGFVLALVLGAAVALLLRGAGVVLARAAARSPAERRGRAPVIGRPAVRLSRPLDALARNLAGRGPPRPLAVE